MGKVFLSHSSYDKEYVKTVADLLGRDNCIFDAYTFEAAMKNIDEIFRGLDKSDIFVYFISNQSLNSEWVSLELNNAIEKLGNMSNKVRQIFPIIIDKNIEYSDSRIADFLKSGKNSYNLRHINNPKIAYRKIKSQLTSIFMENDSEYKKSFEFYCGKDDAKASFKKRYYDMSTGPIKCMVISGIDGIGRKSYIRAVLRDVGIIEPYYEPMLLTLNRDDGIEDLAVRLSLDLGLGEYKYEDIIGLKTIEEKEKMIVELLNKAQEYQEHIIIEDNLCLINQNGNIKYWFEKILERIAPKLVVSITSRIVIDNFQYKKCKYIYQFSVTELTSSETAEFIDMYSKINKIRFEREDIRTILPVLSGYPPQAEYCIEIALKESVEYVKNNLDEIKKKPEQISSKLLVLVIEDGLENEYKALLRLLADFGTMPITLLYDIMNKNEKYKSIFYRLRNFSLCYHTGASREYIKLNSVIQNFVLRNEYSIGDEIKGIVEERAIDFYEKVQDDDDYIDLLSNSEIKYFLKKGIMEEHDTLPEKYLYSALFLQSIIELYNKRKYNQIIKIVDKLISSTNLGNYEQDIESRIRYYYCLALAREKSVIFDSQVEFFRKTTYTYVSYNFLKGFNYRIQGNFERAEQSFNNIINKGYTDSKTFRELVYIYTTNEEFDKAENIAYHNYCLDKNSIYAIQAYCDCLLFKKYKSDEDIRYIEEMIDTVKEVYLSTDMNSMYYQILAKYEAFMNRDIELAVKIIEEGIEKNDFITYLLKDLFDIYEYDGNGTKMRDTYLRMLGECKKNEEDKRLEAALEIKKAISDAYMGKSKIEITLHINKSKLLLPRVKSKLIKKIEMLDKK